MKNIDKCVMWVSCAVVAVAGLWFTKSPWCVWVILIPAALAIGE